MVRLLVVPAADWPGGGPSVSSDLLASGVAPEPGRPRVWWRLYPALVAAAPPLSIAANYPRLFAFTDALAISAALAAGVAVIWAVGYLALRLRFRRTYAADGAALVALVPVVGFYALVPLRAARGLLERHPAASVLAAVLCAGAAVVLWRTAAIGRHVGRLREPWSMVRGANRYFTVFGSLLVGWSAARIGYHAAYGAVATHRSALTTEFRAPVPVRPGTAAGPRRDVYVLVLDEYPRADVLRDRFGFDNRAFEDSLRALGFRVPAETRSNYAVTGLSVASLLNFAHVWRLASVTSWTHRGYAPAAYLLDHPRAARFLKARGYQFVFFPSAWYAPTRDNPDADVVYDPYAGLDLRRSILRSELATHLASVTMYTYALERGPTYQEVQARHAALTFTGVARLATRPAGAPPVFAVAHVLLPHVPMIVDAECRPLPRGTNLVGNWPSRSARVRAAVGGQVRCVDRQVLATVRALLARPGPRPVIVLQGDHGTQATSTWSRWPKPLSAGQSRERFAAFGAYYFPDGGAALLPDTVSVVNVLRYAFSYYFGADLPPLPNTMHASHWRYLYAMTDVDTVTYAPGRQTGR